MPGVGTTSCGLVPLNGNRLPEVKDCPPMPSVG